MVAVRVEDVETVKEYISSLESEQHAPGMQMALDLLGLR